MNLMMHCNTQQALSPQHKKMPPQHKGQLCSPRYLLSSLLPCLLPSLPLTSPCTQSLQHLLLPCKHTPFSCLPLTSLSITLSALLTGQLIPLSRSNSPFPLHHPLFIHPHTPLSLQPLSLHSPSHSPPSLATQITLSSLVRTLPSHVCLSPHSPSASSHSHTCLSLHCQSPSPHSPLPCSSPERQLVAPRVDGSGVTVRC